MTAAPREVSQEDDHQVAAARALEKLQRRYAIVESRVPCGTREWIVYHPRSTDELLDEAAFHQDGRIPYWAEIWPAARVLSPLVARLNGANQRLLELGAGVGTGTLAALLAGFQVTATDYYPEALEFIEANALANQLPLPTLRLADWRAWPSDLVGFDWVIGADLLYEPPMSSLVAAVLRQALRPGGTALVADPQRRHAENFASCCRALGLTAARESHAARVGVVEGMQVDLYRVIRPDG